ncbi:MAG: tetratricopeptide repeat protein [Tannerellaceae bacterium]|jgi:tetratricopeptide (TPR) repeat protein|nr:tetratricopeptide repeat protein [Tannerellaceae bacterium]
MEELVQAEKQMATNPDRALAILKEFEEKNGDSQISETLSKNQYALWCLLLTQAQDKNNIKQTSDSLIQVAVDYFEKKNDKPHLMKAYYYNAVIFHDMGDSPHAQEYYLKALDIGKNAGDHAMLGRIYANMGSMYNYQNLTEDAKSCQEKALEHFLAMKDSVNIGITWRNIGRIYSKNRKLDSAAIYYSKAIPFLSVKNCSSIYNEIGEIYKRLGQYPEAFEYIRLAFESLTEKNDTTALYLNLGDFYRKTGQYDSAYYYLSLSVTSSNIYTKAGATLGLSYLEEEQQNYLTSLMLRERYLQLQDSIKIREQGETLQRIQSLYNYNQIEKEHFALEHKANQKTLQFYIALTIIFVLNIIFISSFQRLKKINWKRYEKELRLLEQKQHEKTQEHLAKQKKMIDIFKQSLLYQKIATQEKINDDDWEELQKEIEFIYPDFTAHVEKLLPNADRIDIHLCYLAKINISSVQTGRLFCLGRSAITKKKQALYKKISSMDGKAKDFDIFMINFQ